MQRKRRVIVAMIDSTKTGGFETWLNGLSAFVERQIAEARITTRRMRVYRATLDELEALSPRELSDLGICGCSLRAIAREQALKQVP